MGENVPIIREYTAMAIMGCFTISMIMLIVWATKRLVTKAINGFDMISTAIKTSNEAIWSLKTAIDINTAQLHEHRKMSEAYVERLSREIREAHENDSS